MVTETSPVAEDGARRNRRPIIVSILVVLALIIGFVVLAGISIHRGYMDRIEADSSAYKRAVTTIIRDNQTEIIGDLEALSGLYNASTVVDADELLAFSQIVLSSGDGLLSDAQYGWISHIREEPSYIIRKSETFDVVEARVLTPAIREYLAKRVWEDPEFSGVVFGPVVAGEAVSTTLSFLVYLPRGGENAGTLFVTLTGGSIFPALALPEGVRPVSVRHETPTNTVTLYDAPVDPAGGAVQTINVPMLGGTTMVDLQISSIPFQDYFLAEELKSLLIGIVLLGFIISNILLNLRQIHLGRIAAERAMQAARDAEDSNYQKSRFLATMSHEMRTPLNGIIGMADLIKISELPEEKNRFLMALTSSAEGLLALINQLLDFSKIEARSIELEETEVNLGKLLIDVANASNILAADKNVEVVLSLPMQAYLPVRIDGFKLRQVLTNLVSNAIKFTERGSVTLSVEMVGKASDTEATFKFSVTDTGIGIAADRLDDIFEPFRQADISTTRNFGGTGLGLTISRDILRAMGSEMSVSSTVGQGTVFSFEIEMQGDIFARPLRRKASFLGFHKILIYGAPSAAMRAVEIAVGTAGATVEVATSKDSAEKAILAAHEQEDPINIALVLTPEHAADLQAYRYDNNSESIMKIGLLRNSLRSGHPVTEDERVLSDFRIEFPHTSPGIVERIYHELSGRRAIVENAPKTFKAKEVALTGIHVLLVDDDQTNQLYGAALLGKLGCQVSQAWNGQEAIAILEKDPSIQLMLLDCQMPVMDGFTAAGILRKRMDAEELPRVPIVALTANAAASDRQAVLDAGMDDFLAKPVRKPEMTAIFEKWLKESIQRPAATPAVTSAPPPEPSNTTQPLVSPDAAAGPAPQFISQRNAPTPAIKNMEDLPAPIAHEESPTKATASPTDAIPPTLKAPILDAEALRETRDMVGDAFNRLLQTFVSSAPETVAQLGAFLNAKDYDSAQRAAHQIKSSSRMVGAMAMSHAAMELEAECKQTVPSSKRAIEYGRVIDYGFREYVNQLRNIQNQRQKSA